MRHWTREDMGALLAPDAPRAERAAAVRHLLAGCEWCAAVARRTARGSGEEAEYDRAIDRVIARLPELARVAAGGAGYQGSKQS